MFSQELESLIQATLADGVLTETEKSALVKRAEREGVDLTELEIYIESLLQKRIQTESISKEEKALAREKERKGNVCPHCGTPIPPLTKTCPNCGAAVGSNETVGDKELTKLVDDLESAIVNLKSTNPAGFSRAKAEVESLIRKAKTFYGENKKVQVLVFDLEEEMKKALESYQKSKKQELGKNIGKRVIWALLLCALLFVGMGLAFLPFLSSGYRGILGDLWRRLISDGESDQKSDNTTYKKPNSSVEVFEAQLLDFEKHEKEGKISNLLRSTKVPDDRGELLELLGILEPRLASTSWSSRVCHDEFLELYKKALNKARTRYGKDADFEYYFNAKTNASLKDRILW